MMLSQMSSLLSLSLVELAGALQARKASPVDLMKEVFEAVDRLNPRFNAIVAERDRSALLADAEAAEKRIARGEGRALEGIPFGVKDLEDAEGLPTTHGSVPFRGVMPESDSTQVARLRGAGAILYGKTNTPEFGSNAITKNLLFGETRSPWDAARTSGGSSGGSSAALSAEMLPLVTASDGGGSIRIPASFVGAIGLKPSFGRVPVGPFPIWDHGTTTVYGPLTKTVEDAALFLDLVAGFDAYDPRSLPRPERSYLEAVRSSIGRSLRIGYSPDLGYAVVQSDVAAVVEDAVRVFEKLGHSVRAIDGGPPEMGAQWGLLTAFEVGARIAGLRPEHEAKFGRALMDTLRYVEAMTQNMWGEISRNRAKVVEWCAKAFADFDLLVTPTVPYDPPPARGPFPSDTEGRPQITASVAAFTIPFNMSWNPAATVRAGLSRAGLPVGLQIVGPHHREDLVLQAARAFERERPAHPAWPLRRGDD
jgi:aspartyl-tRNA(Asn)/glutamyl-tRNA(Gln) amidotransferase subunit A